VAVQAFILLAVLVGVVSIFVLSSIKVVRQIERGVVFRWGKVQPQFRPPGLTVIFPVMDRMTKVNMQTIAMGVPAQEGITQDNVSVRVDAVVYFRVVDPVKATVNVQNYNWAVSQVAQTSLRSVIGQADMQQLLSDRESINIELQRIMDQATEAPWGAKIQRVEIKDVSLPEGMKRSMSRQAEAERERRARIITADGEFQASKRLAAAAEIMSQDPAALQLRLLQTVVEVSAEKNSTLVMPLPVEILRFFDGAGVLVIVIGRVMITATGVIPLAWRPAHPWPLVMILHYRVQSIMHSVKLLSLSSQVVFNQEYSDRHFGYDYR